MQQGINQTAFGEFHLVPALQISGDGQIRDGLVHSAGDAEGIFVIDRHEPIANFVFAAILTLAIFPAFGGGRHRLPTILREWFQRAEVQNVRQKTKGVAAFDALDVFKKNEAFAVVAIKGFHSELCYGNSFADDKEEGDYPTKGS